LDTDLFSTLLASNEEDFHEESPFPTGTSSWKVAFKPHTWHPPTDLYETEDNFIIRVEVAGMNQEEFCVSLNDDILDITGTRPDEFLRRAFHQMEIPFGEFRTTVHVPSPVDGSRVGAEYRDGFLEVTLPKVPTSMINIKAE
jgi:HSP20 family protein